MDTDPGLAKVSHAAGADSVAGARVRVTIAPTSPSTGLRPLPGGRSDRRAKAATQAAAREPAPVRKRRVWRILAAGAGILTVAGVILLAYRRSVVASSAVPPVPGAQPVAASPRLPDAGRSAAAPAVEEDRSLARSAASSAPRERRLRSRADVPSLRRGERVAPKPRRPIAVADRRKEVQDSGAATPTPTVDAAPLRPAATDAEPTAGAPGEQEVIRRAAWNRRLSEIERLIQERSYPEAKRLADNLAGETSVPAEVQREARELAVRAQTELKRIFAGAAFGAESHKVQPKSPPPPA